MYLTLDKVITYIIQLNRIFPNIRGIAIQVRKANRYIDFS